MQRRPIQVTTPAPRDVWQEVLKADPDALVFQTPEWLDCICEMGGYHDASFFYETSDGRQLIMPIVRRNRWPASLTTQASLPRSWGVGGIIAKGAVFAADISAILSYLAAEPVMRTYIWPNPLAAETWAAARLPGVISVPRLAHVLDLKDGGIRSGQSASGDRHAGRCEKQNAPSWL